MKATIIGYGSIGKRHAEVLNELDVDVSVVSRREIDVPKRYATLQAAIKEHQPEYVVIANNTNEHFGAFEELVALGYQGRVLIEKPLFERVIEPSTVPKDVFVAYNMRFNPLLQKLVNVLEGSHIISAQAYVGQYLPDWRPGTDYRNLYSADKESGGGVLRDLSHELDYLCWLFNDWTSVTALGGQFSSLEINSDDVFCLMLQMERCPVVTVQLNYLDKVTHRELLINTGQHTIKVDFVQKSLQIDDHIESFEYDANHTYKKQHQAIMDRDLKSLCSFQDGMNVLRLIDAAEQSAYSTNRTWITNANLEK